MVQQHLLSGEKRTFGHICWLFQASGQELIDALKPAFVKAIKEFYKANHAWPEKILVFRDGVGDSQLSIVARYKKARLTYS